MVACWRATSARNIRTSRGATGQRPEVAQKIELRLGPALETLDALVAAGEEGTYDFVFIDADKSNYPPTTSAPSRCSGPGGLAAVDNTLWYGHVADTTNTDADTESIRALNRRIHSDSRVFASLLPLADGLTFALKLP